MKSRQIFVIFAALFLLLSPVTAAAEVTISLDRAVLNGQDITLSRKITVAPGTPLAGSFTVTVRNDFRDSTSVPVAATPNWWWGGIRSNADIFTELSPGVPAGQTNLTYTLPGGMSAPRDEGRYYIGVFAGVAADSRQLMSCDMNPAGSYAWNSYPDGETTAIDVSYWSSLFWNQAVTGNHVGGDPGEPVLGFRFCHLEDCYDNYGYGAAAVVVEVAEASVPEEIRLGPAADTLISSSLWRACGHDRKSERYTHYGSTRHLEVVRGIHQGQGKYREWKGILIRFDLSEVPPGAELLEAKLFLFHSGGPREQISIHRMKIDWVETEASWYAPFEKADPWWAGWSDGRNYEPAATDMQLVSGKGWMAWDVTADVSMYLDGTPNFGWFLKSAKTKGHDLSPLFFRSKEARNADVRPYLLLKFASGGEVY